ncbi:hypothetical protein AVEN_267371-1 [Araneus ventricosus]|uniref:Uncharacterized protein n=1 Tax=Araneus ventricosus TaxID=182803 RepID=A0A4Y2WKG6_ARAVE|nr:hypothetical protein AVEN_267371-1 [Araneus ventricosus]
MKDLELPLAFLLYPTKRNTKLVVSYKQTGKSRAEHSRCSSGPWWPNGTVSAFGTREIQVLNPIPLKIPVYLGLVRVKSNVLGQMSSRWSSSSDLVQNDEALPQIAPVLLINVCV